MADCWTRLVYDDPTPTHELHACHLVKWHISEARHLADKHGIRFDRQVPLDGCQAQHNECHNTTNANFVPHPHEFMLNASALSRSHDPHRLGSETRDSV